MLRKLSYDYDEKQEPREWLSQSVGDIGVATIGSDGDNVVYTATMNPPPAGMEYDVEQLRIDMDAMWSDDEETAEAMGLYAALIKAFVQAEDPKVILEFLLYDGTEIYSIEYSAAE